MKARLIRWSILLIVGFGIGSIIGYFQATTDLGRDEFEMSPDYANIAEVLKQPHDVIKIGGDFSLTDQDGQTVTLKNYADNYKLIFFGFTFCPAVCPTELQKIAGVMDELGDNAKNVTPIFITVDPDRDTPEVIKAYVEQFHPKMVGLTGTQEQIDVVKQAYRIYANKVENEHMEGYMMDHSSFTYLVGPDNLVDSMYPSKDTVEDIVKSIKSKL